MSSELSLVSKLLELEAQGQFFRLIELEVKRGDLTKDVKHAKKLEAFILHNYRAWGRSNGEGIWYRTSW